jgi:hypothetical protein
MKTTARGELDQSALAMKFGNSLASVQRCVGRILGDHFKSGQRLAASRRLPMRLPRVEPEASKAEPHQIPMVEHPS